MPTEKPRFTLIMDEKLLNLLTIIDLRTVIPAAPPQRLTCFAKAWNRSGKNRIVKKRSDFCVLMLEDGTN